MDTLRRLGSLLIQVSQISDVYKRQAEGYVCARTLTPGKKIKALLTREGDATYTYNLPSDGSYAVLPLTCGDGVYTLNIYHNLTGDQYVQDPVSYTHLDVYKRQAGYKGW